MLVYENDVSSVCVIGSSTHNDEMCNLYVMFFTENGQRTFFMCGENSFPRLFDDIPAGNDVPLPADQYLDAVATGQVHKGTGRLF